jgi:hypothetical protein
MKYSAKEIPYFAQESFDATGLNNNAYSFPSDETQTASPAGFRADSNKMFSVLSALYQREGSVTVGNAVPYFLQIA